MEVFGLALLPHDIAYAISRHPKKLGTPGNLAAPLLRSRWHPG
jgi:hypothetical protein